MAGLAPGRQRDRPRRAAGDAELAGRLEAAAADNVKRVLRAAGRQRAGLDRRPRTWRRMRAFLETKTVWHPKGT